MSEIEAFPRAVLSHHYADTALHGDFTTIQPGHYEPIDVLVGGTPCQSFSVAGLRGGMADARGNLALEYLRLADRLRPTWLVWENVPGVLSSNGGRDFGSFLGGLGQLGYGFAYRVLDAQHFGLAQRRKRVFVVGYFGDWRRAAAVLFEPASLRWHPAPRRQAGEGVAKCLANGTGSSGEQRYDGESEDFVVSDIAPSITSNPYGDHESREGLLVAQTLCAGGHSNNPLDETLIAWDGAQITSKECRSRVEPGQPSPTLNGAGQAHVAYAIQERAVCENANAGPDGAGWREGTAYTLEARSVPQAIAFDWQKGNDVTNRRPSTMYVSEEQSGTLSATRVPGLCKQSAVRRLTPRECERLQGFPDDYTLIPYRGKPAADGPRYKALGNSMAVPCMAWIGRRIAHQSLALQVAA